MSLVFLKYIKNFFIRCLSPINRTSDSDINLASRIVDGYEIDTFFIAYIVTNCEYNRNNLHDKQYLTYGACQYMTDYVIYKKHALPNDNSDSRYRIQKACNECKPKR